MLDRIWTTAKAVFGVGLLVAGALLAAQKLDRERARQAEPVALRAVVPETTGSITPGALGAATSAPAR